MESDNSTVEDGAWCLYKLCRREHNLALGADTVRLGNLSYYRTFEDADIGDIHEGVKETSIIINGVAIPTHYLSSFNLIFCATSRAPTHFSDYDSCYKITDPAAFGRILGEELLNQAPRNKIQSPVLASDTAAMCIKSGPTTLAELEQMDLVVERRFVRYLDAHSVRREDMAIGIIPFWKATKYLDQSEYRYLFRFCSNIGLADLSQYLDPYIDLDLSYQDELPVENYDLPA